MTLPITQSDLDLEKLIIQGDLSSLTKDQKVQYYYQRCKDHGLSPTSKPFEYIKLNGKEVLYATKGCAEQLRSVHGVSIDITKAEQVGDVFVVIAKAKDKNGREDSATGAVSISGLKGEALANAMMKAETKAKRRVTLSVCGLNMLDETETETIKQDNQKVLPEQPPQDGGDGNVVPRVWTFGFGKWTGRTLEQVSSDPSVGLEGLRSYVKFLEESSKKSGKPLNDRALEAIEHIEAFVGAIENNFKEEEQTPELFT